MLGLSIAHAGFSGVTQKKPAYKQSRCGARWANPAFGRQRQEDHHKLEANLCMQLVPDLSGLHFKTRPQNKASIYTFSNKGDKLLWDPRGTTNSPALGRRVTLESQQPRGFPCNPDSSFLVLSTLFLQTQVQYGFSSPLNNTQG